MHPLEEKLNSFINKKTKNYFVAYSGGIDSTVLLNCVNRIIKSYKGLSVIALHINHNYSDESNAWKNHCIDFCNKRNIKILTFDLDLSKLKGASLENQLRDLRYKVFEENVGKDEKLFMAHHLDDNVETLFLRLFRGTGLKGVKSIPFKRSLGKGELVRPFLDVPKKDIEKYAADKELNFISDKSNDDINYDRNFIRNEIIPSIKKRWPKYNHSIEKFILNANESYEIVNNQTKIDFSAVCSNKKNQIFLSKLIALPKNRQKNIIIFWIDTLNLNPPNGKVLNEIVDKFVFATKNKNPTLFWGTKEKEGSVCLKIKKDNMIAESIS